MKQTAQLIGNQDAIIDRIAILVNRTKMDKADRKKILSEIDNLKNKNEEIFESLKESIL